MNIDDLNELLNNIKDAIVRHKDGHYCRRCQRKMPSIVAGICLDAGVYKDEEPRKVWNVNWRPTEKGWAHIEIESHEFWLCPACTNETLPFELK